MNEPEIIINGINIGPDKTMISGKSVYPCIKCQKTFVLHEGIMCIRCAQVYNSESDGENEMPKDMINSPAHYQGKNGLEVIDVIESFDLNFNLGNAIKYILRADKKGSKVENLKKAIWYLEREIVKSGMIVYEDTNEKK